MASAQISETTRPAYLWSGSEWIPIGDGGGGGGGEIFYQSASPSAPAVGTLWVDEDGSLEDEIAGISHDHDLTYLSLNTASNTYLTINNASSTYATIVDLNNIDLTSTINTASAAAYASASAYTNNQIANINLSSTIQTASAAAVNYLVDGAPGALDTLNELAAALNDNADILNLYLTQSSASTLYEPNIQYISASPSSPSAGTLWIDSTNSTAPALKVYNGTTWIAVSGAASESGFHPFFGAYK
jgi:hypothetical protein